MKGSIRRIILYSFVILLTASSSGLAASFYADMVTTKDGNIETGKFYLSGHFYRIETREDSKPVVIIVDREKKVHSVLNMTAKTFFEISSDNKKLLSKDPFLLSGYIVKKYGVKVEGTEKINGFICEKQVVATQKFARWFSNDLKFPLKTVTYEGEQERCVTELKGIKQCRLSKNLFAVPADFINTDDPIYAKCTSQKENPGPWCYQEEVKKIGDPALCENIIKYWPKATGVRGQCYYELARKKMDCELCERIKDKDIKKMCELDVCK